MFGGSIAAYEGTFIVGASKDDDKGSDSGSAYIFTMPYLETAAVRDEPRWHTNIDFDVSGDLHFTGELYKNGSVINTGGAQGAQGAQGYQGPANGYQGCLLYTSPSPRD